MNHVTRRDFLARLGFGTLSAAAATLTFDVEWLLWIPGERTIIEVVPPDWEMIPVTVEWVSRKQSPLSSPSWIIPICVRWSTARHA